MRNDRMKKVTEANSCQPRHRGALLVVVVISVCLCGNVVSFVKPAGAQGSSSALTPIQLEIERLRQRLDSTDVEERRDALTRLGNLKRPEAARAALKGLSDPIPVVRVTAAHATVHLGDEAALKLIPLLQDRLEFVRQETAYALGETRSRSAVLPLSSALIQDKKNSVRGAAAVALG